MHYEWTVEKAKYYSEVFEFGRINSKYFSHLTDILEIYFDSQELPVELVSTFRQSSFITHRKDQSAIFFDFGQSFILKNIFKQISDGKGFSRITEILKQSGCLSILNQDYRYAKLIFICPQIPFVNYYLANNNDLKIYSESLQSISKILSTPYFTEMIDHYIIGHELFHYLKKRNLTEGDWEQESKGYFDFSLAQCCYENHPDFKKIATYYGKVMIDNDGLNKIRRDLEIRRDYYNLNKDFLIEEITCDMFSFKMIAELLNYKYSLNNFQLKNLCYLFYMIFSIFDLYYAINKRFSLSSKSSIHDVKSAESANINFRKVALVEIMCNYLIDKFFPENSNSKKRNSFYSDFHNDMFKFKLMVDNLYIMPTTNAIKDILNNCEKLKKSLPEEIVSKYEITSLINRIIDRDELFNVNEKSTAFN